MREKSAAEKLFKLDELSSLCAGIGDIYKQYGLQMRFLRNPKLWANCYVENQSDFAKQTQCDVTDYIKLLEDTLRAHQALIREFKIAAKYSKMIDSRQKPAEQEAAHE